MRDFLRPRWRATDARDDPTSGASFVLSACGRRMFAGGAGGGGGAALGGAPEVCSQAARGWNQRLQRDGRGIARRVRAGRGGGDSTGTWGRGGAGCRVPARWRLAGWTGRGCGGRARSGRTHEGLGTSTNRRRARPEGSRACTVMFVRGPVLRRRSRRAPRASKLRRVLRPQSGQSSRRRIACARAHAVAGALSRTPRLGRWRTSREHEPVLVETASSWAGLAHAADRRLLHDRTENSSV